ncbi:hypothetical protein [Sphingobium yanoikuyae]|uniref:hypothetical protein n=1 Tax=Sphingobium yanoikuyae TaxID=13690 RepID=UPI0012DA11F9|nr:hypothetical protein [Sphingobium yanoikuyae]
MLARLAIVDRLKIEYTYPNQKQSECLNSRRRSASRNTWIAGNRAGPQSFEMARNSAHLQKVPTASFAVHLSDGGKVAGSGGRYFRKATGRGQVIVRAFVEDQ